MDLRTSRSKRNIFLFIAGFIGGPALLTGIYMLTIGRPALAGDVHHDFGYIAIENGSGSATHTFTLTNRTDSPLTIQDVRASCGCTTAEIGSGVIEPGENLEIEATLTVSSSGLRTSDITVFMENRGTRKLTLEGVGRRSRQITASRDRLHLRPDSEKRFSVFAEIWEDDDASAPTVAAPENVEASVTNWREQPLANRNTREPARWVGQVNVSRTGPLPEDAELVVILNEHQRVKVVLAE